VVLSSSEDAVSAYGIWMEMIAHGLSITMVASGFLKNYMMHMHLLFLLFPWLIFMNYEYLV
jgi:hypothetical protein